MNKLLTIFFVTLFFYGCSSVRYNIENVKPNEYGLDTNINNRIFAITCTGNTGIDLIYVKKVCLKKISDIAHTNGYSYFTILDKKNGSINSTGSYTINTPITTYSNSTFSNGKSTFYGTSSNTYYIPQTNIYSITEYYKHYLFILIRENELTKYNNYYKVIDYLDN